VAAAATIETATRHLGAIIAIAVALAAATLVLYRLSIPYGRFWLITLGCGLAGFIFIATAASKRYE
jgi:hypothetical protein